MSSQKPLWLFAAPIMFLLLWSGGYTVAKIGLQYATPMALLALRYLSVVVIMAVLWVILRPPLPKTWVGWGHLAWVGFLIQTIYFGLSYLAFIAGIAAGTVALLMSFQPIIVAILAPRWTGEQTSWRQWSGLGLAMLGTVAVIFARSEIEPPSALGLLSAIIGLLGITGATLWEKRFGLSYHPVSANLIGFAAGLIGLLPLLLLFENPSVTWTWSFVGALGYLVIGNSVIAVGLLLAMIRAGEVSKVSALFFLVPPLAALIAWLALGEVMPPLAWIGLVAAGVGVLLATRK